jgi:hypothetical protein
LSPANSRDAVDPRIVAHHPKNRTDEPLAGQTGRVIDDQTDDIDAPKRFLASILNLWEVEVWISDRMALGCQAVLVQCPPIIEQVFRLTAADPSEIVLPAEELIA